MRLRPPLPLSCQRPGSLLAALPWVIHALTVTLAQADETATPGGRGAALYRDRCASCHGERGEGVKDRHETALVGDRSVLQLARYVQKNMPEDKPGTLTGEEAEAIATHVHGAFYSPLARERNRPARRELSRLTARQISQALTDLIGSFRRPSGPCAPGGLRAEYFDSRQPGDKRVVERVDSQVRFDFGRSTPAFAGLETTGFSARWTGSLLAPDSGEHEIIVRTDHAARLWLNDDSRPLIDAWVKSGNDLEYRARIHLLGGRAYPLKLELSSRKQGVDDSQKKKSDGKPVQTLIELCWKPPVGTFAVIPTRCLSPESTSAVFAVQTVFPPDDRSVGFERGVSISKAFDDAATRAALETAAYVVRHLAELGGTSRSPPDHETRLRAFLATFVQRAFRRPLSASQRELYVDRHFQPAPRDIAELEAAVKRAVILTLKSPRFLLVGQDDQQADAFTVASRLALVLWDSLPDAALLEAAAAGGLGAREQVAREAERMLEDPRARSKARRFFLQWLGVDPPPELEKDTSRFPEHAAELASDLRTSLDLFLDDVVWGESADFRRLLLANEMYLSGRLARHYGYNLEQDAPFQKLSVDPEKHAGLLSHPYLMARFAYPEASSPIHRGVFIVRSFLGRTLQPPPEAVAPLAPELHPAMTTRERVAQQTEPKACRSCHDMINPLGFALEHYDATGRYREEDRGKPIDASGAYEPPTGDTRNFRGVRGLAEALAASKEVHSAFVRHLFHHFVKQPILAHGPETPGELEWVFAASGYNVRELLSEIAATAALVGLPGRGQPELLRAF